MFSVIKELESDSLQLDTNDSEALNELFKFCKDEIQRVLLEIDIESEEFLMIQQLMENESFTTVEPIRNRKEFRGRLDTLIDIIEGFSPSVQNSIEGGGDNVNSGDESIIRAIDRKTMIAMNSGFHFKPDQGGEFTRIFEFYKSQIMKIESSSDTEGKAAMLLETLMSHPAFLNDEPILSRQEFSRRIGSMASVVEKHLE